MKSEIGEDHSVSGRWQASMSVMAPFHSEMLSENYHPAWPMRLRIIPL